MGQNSTHILHTSASSLGLAQSPKAEELQHCKKEIDSLNTEVWVQLYSATQ